MNTLKKGYPFMCAVTAILVSATAAQAQLPAEPPDPRSRSEVESALAKAPKVSIENLRDLIVLKRFLFHDMAPVTGRVTH